MGKGEISGSPLQEEEVETGAKLYGGNLSSQVVRTHKYKSSTYSYQYKNMSIYMYVYRERRKKEKAFN
jgi:hypothetical protein